MYPFFNILGVQIPAYGSMMLLAALTAFGLTALQTYKSALWQDAFNYYFFALVGALSGAFLLHVAVTIPVVIARWDTLMAGLSFKEGFTVLAQSLTGFVFYGGLLGSIASMIIYSRVFKTPLLPYLDVFAPIVPVAHAIGRVGCFLGGCCYGIEVGHDHPLGVIYPAASLAAPPGQPLLAVQLIEAVLNLLIACVLFMIKKKKPAPGTLAAGYLMIYACSRFALEYFRGDLIRGVYHGVSTSQIISALLFISGAALLLFALKNKQTASPEHHD